MGVHRKQHHRWASAMGAYPAKLQTLLGPAFLVENDGVSGRTLLKKGGFSYWDKGKLANVFAFKPDIVTIKLGTNDSKPKIYLMIPYPSFGDQTVPSGIRGTIIANEIIPLIKKVAAAKNVGIIDLYTPMFAHKELFPDNIHPNAVGQDTIAHVLFRALKAGTVAAPGFGPRKAIYPNVSMAHGTLSVTLRAGGKCLGRLYALDGRQVLELPLRNGEATVANLAGYAPGRYFLTVENAQGGPMAVKNVTLEAGQP